MTSDKGNANNQTSTQRGTAADASPAARVGIEQLKPAETVSIGKLIAVMSGKGGVGKSSVAALLATGLSRLGKRVGILDADVTGPSIPRMFGVGGQPAVGPNDLILPVKSRGGIAIMSMNLFLGQEDRPVIWRGPIISGAVKQFYHEVLWGDLDYLIVDLPPGTGDAPLTVLQSLPVDGIILVTSPQSLVSMVVRKARHMAESLAVPVIGIIENFASYRCPHCGEISAPFGGQRASCNDKEADGNHDGLPLLAQLPVDPDLAAAADAGRIEGFNAPWLGELVRCYKEHER